MKIFKKKLIKLYKINKKVNKFFIYNINKIKNYTFYTYLDNKRYYGITAINKEHNMSFGISSPGYAETNLNKAIAGSQFILINGNKAGVQYSLTQAADMQQGSNIYLSNYAQDSTLVKGTFTAFLTPKPKSDSSFYRARGQFDLKIKQHL